MKRKVVMEPDLYVINKKPTKKEIEELREFIREHGKKLNFKSIKNIKFA